MSMAYIYCEDLYWLCLPVLRRVEIVNNNAQITTNVSVNRERSSSTKQCFVEDDSAAGTFQFAERTSICVFV